MPTIIDATVVNQPYYTSGSGGRKLVRLSNGTLVALVKDTASYYYRLYKSTDGQTWSSLANDGAWSSAMGDAAIATNGTYIYLLRATSASQLQFIVYREDGTHFGGNILDTGQNAIGNVSLTINEDGTELHAAWASRNPTYPNSFNIRYAKGTINGDGSVTWGAVEQRTTFNVSGIDAKDPCIILKNNNPIILHSWNNSTSSYRIYAKVYGHTSWTDTYGVVVYDGGSYAQYFPSACVDKNGRIWVAWHGAESGYNAGEIRVSYSDDGGVTWSTQQRLTTNNQETSGINPSITVNKNNEIFILYNGRYGTATYKDIYLLHYNGSSWTNTNITNTPTTGHNQNPSALVDLAIDFTQPLFIYSAVQRAKVGFYGTWTVTTISVTPGYIGQKTSSDKSNILTYSITTDGEMSDITEKINGVTIATRTNPTSGQEFTVSLTQEQWDAIKFGNGHTLTIEMDSDTWTYTFDKRLNVNDDILSAVKGVHDLQDHLNAIKAQLASAIRSKGGTVNDTDPFSAFVSVISNMTNKRWATGYTTTSVGAVLTVTGLSFRPKTIIIRGYTIGYNNVIQRVYSTEYNLSSVVSNYAFYNDRATLTNPTVNEGPIPFTINNDGFSVQIAQTNAPTNNTPVGWIAFE